MNSKFEEALKNIEDERFLNDRIGNLERDRRTDLIIRMEEMQKLIKKCITIVNTTEVPLRLEQDLERIVEDFLDLKKLWNGTLTGEGFNPNIFDRIASAHANFFEISSSNKTLMTINAITNYQFFFEEEPLMKLNDLTSQLSEKNERVDKILEKLEKPSAEKVLADYASEYANEEIKSNKASKGWLTTGVLSTITFIILIVCSIINEWFPTKMSLKNEINSVVSAHEIINIPVLVTKVMLVSLIAYFILFCFRQYSINKHLSVVNQQRKNAFNSYVLFAAAIGDKDTEARKVLLMSLARTIHESINTGFLSTKQSDQPLIQNVDLGKLSAISSEVQ